MGAPGFWDDPDARRQGQRRARAHDTPPRDLHGARGRRRGPRRARRARRGGPGARRRARGAARVASSRASRSSSTQRLFSGHYDAGDALVTVNAGAGGTDAQDWAEMVLRMEMRWAERRGFKVELLEASAGEEAGIKSATFRVSGRERLRALRRREGRPPARAHLAVRLASRAARPPSPASRSSPVLEDTGDDRDRRRRPADRHLPRVGRRRPARQQDRLRGAHHPPAVAASSCSARTSARRRRTSRRR